MSLSIFVLIVLSRVLNVLAQIFFKDGVNKMGFSPDIGLKNYRNFVGQVLKSPPIVCGILWMTLGMALWLVVLASCDLSLAFPFDSMQDILVLGAAYFILREKITRKRIVGVLLIVSGLVLVGQSS